MSASSSSRRAPNLSVEIEDVFNRSLISSYPMLNEMCHFAHLKGEPFEKYGDDYMCSNVPSIRTKLKAKHLKILSEDIAETIVNNLPKSDMIQKVSIRCGCFLTFKLSREWMDKRVENMLANGIKTWAPTYDLEKAVVRFPKSGIGSDMHADDIRAYCIQEMLNSTFTYCGVEVFSDYLFKKWGGDKALKAVEEVGKHFLIEEGKFKKKSGRMDEPPLFVAAKTEEPVSTGNEIAFKDLADLWLAIYQRKADLIVYLAPLRRQEYIERCFEAARDVQWLNDDRLSYCGYRTSPNEKEKITCLMREFWNYSKFTSLVDLGKAAGYVTETDKEVFELALKYAYLKTHKWAEFSSSIDELFDEKGNTFVYLLHTQALVRSVIENPRRGKPKLMKALVAKEHELASHLVRFTEVLEEACSLILPNKLCEYLYDLSKKFTSCYGEIRPVETGLLLCKATSVVMEKCFHLLGISPTCSGGYVYEELFVSLKAPKIVNPFIPWSNSDDGRLDNPRVELFSMFISINDAIEKGTLYGVISLKDDKTTGFVDFFSQGMCKPFAICNNSYIPFSNPSAIYEWYFNSPIEIYMNLIVKDDARKDAFELSCGKGALKTSNFWQEKKIRTKCDTIAFENNIGLLQIHYILLKDALDTTLEVTFESPDSKGLQVRGHIFAWYGESVLDELPDAQRMFYHASIFTTDGTRVFPGKKLKLNKSFLAVPAGGDLVLQTVLEDTKSREILVDKQVTYSLKTNKGFESLEMQILEKKDKKKGKAAKGSSSSKSSLAGSFNLTLTWSKGPASSFSA